MSDEEWACLGPFAEGARSMTNSDDAGPDESPQPLVQHLRLFPDAGGVGMLWDHTGANRWPDEWPLSEALQTDLEQWAQRYDDFRPGRTYLYAEDDPAFDLERHNAEGEALRERLGVELGLEWTIEHLALTPGPPIVGQPRLQWPRVRSYPAEKVRLAVAPFGPPLGEIDFSTEEPPLCELRDNGLLLGILPCYEKGFSYAVQPLWRGEHVLPPKLLRHWAVTQRDRPELIFVEARDAMFATFADTMLCDRPNNWSSRHDDVSLTVSPAAQSPYARRYWDRATNGWKMHDPPKDGFDIQMLFRARQDTAFAPANSGVAIRLAIARPALNRFMVAFADAHNRLRLRDEAASEEAGEHVPLHFSWPPDH